MTKMYAPGMSRYGACVKQPQAQDATKMAQLKAAGFEWVRVDALWAYIEQTQGTYTWTTMDAIVSTVKAAGLKLLLILQTMPEWLSGGSTVTTVGTLTSQMVTSYTAFASAIATRYKGQVDGYEMWNEPNLVSFWSPKPSMADWLSMVIPAAQAIKAVDPHIIVVSGGIGGAPDANGDGTGYLSDGVTPNPSIGINVWTPAIFKAGISQYVDAIGVHHYSATPGDTWAADRVKVYATAAGVTKPVWVTETGYATDDTGQIAQTVTEAVQASIIQQGLSAFDAACNLGAVFVYEAWDANTSDAYVSAQSPGDKEQHFGLWHTDNTAKASVATAETVAAGEKWATLRKVPVPTTQA